MTMEENFRQIIQEENQKHLKDIKRLLESHGYHEAPRFLKVPEAAEILRIGITATYELCHQSEINGFPSVRQGKHIRIPYTALMNWIDQQAQQAN